MRRSIISLLMAVAIISMTSIKAMAVDATELQLYMGVKARYVWQEGDKANDGETPGNTEASDNLEAGGASPNSSGYTFTTKDSDELVAQALSDNNPAVTAGFIRQLPMRDLIKVLDVVKSAADILTERSRDDLLAKAYAGGYIAPEHTIVSSDPTGAGGTTVPVNRGDTPVWSLTGELGYVGDKAPVPLGGRINLLSVYGEPYVIGSKQYDAAEVVFDTTKDNKVFALFNGYVSYIGSDVIELMSYDQQVTIRYQNAIGLDGVVAGSVFSQGMQIGTTSDFTLGVSLRVATVQRNLLQIYTERVSKEWYTAWSTKNALRASELVLNTGDTNYHVTVNELPRNAATSYTNAEDYGINPNEKQ